MLRLLFLVFLAPLRLAQENQTWDYSGKHGQQTWCEISNFCCGLHQSPIALYYDKHHRLLTTGLRLLNYKKVPKTVTVRNTGRTVVVEFSNDVTPYIFVAEGGLEKRYKFAFIHFHWGKSNDRGSEHAINNLKAPMEAQLVHFNFKFSSFEGAVNSGKKDSIAIVSVMFHNLDYVTDNDSAINKIASSLEVTRFKTQSTNKTRPFSLSLILPDKTNSFFRYHGSLTTPNCNKNVLWTVFDRPNFITENQLEKFRSLYSTKDGEKPVEFLVDNFRHLQISSLAKFKFVDRSQKLPSTSAILNFVKNYVHLNTQP